MTNAIKLNRARTLQKHLKTLGLTWPSEVLTRAEVEEIPEPTPQEFSDAVANAKGDPATDKNVQLLINRFALIRFGHVNANMKEHEEKQRAALIPDAAATLSEQVRDIHAAAVETLRDNLGALKGQPHLRQVNPSALSVGAQQNAFFAALTALNRAEAARRVWGQLEVLQGASVSPEATHAALYVLANPTLKEYQHALKQSPVDFPTVRDEAGILTHGWDVTLASSSSEAWARLNNLRAGVEPSNTDGEAAVKL